MRSKPDKVSNVHADTFANTPTPKLYSTLLYSRRSHISSPSLFPATATTTLSFFLPFTQLQGSLSPASTSLSHEKIAPPLCLHSFPPHNGRAFNPTMKITPPGTDLSSLLPTTSSTKPPNPSPRKPHSDRRPHSRRKLFTATGSRTPRIQRRNDPRGHSGGSSKRAARGPPTPLLRWKFDDVGETDVDDGCDGGVEDDKKSPEFTVESTGRRKARRDAKGGGMVSARKLAAALWRMQASGFDGGGGEELRSPRRTEDRLGFKRGAGQMADQLANHGKDLPRSPCSVNGPSNGYICKPEASFQLSNYAMEAVTKWDPVHPELSEESFDELEQDLNAVSMVSSLQAELSQARARIDELESERKNSKKKLEHFLRKLSEERTVWRSREHEKVRAIIDDMKSTLSQERKNRQRLEMVNSKLVNELSECKQSAKKFLQNYEKEKKNRELVEEVCDELAKEIGEDKAESDAIKKECLKIREEMEDERKMLQMAEVWREERVQMKLIDAKVTLEDKFTELNHLIADMEWFLKSNGVETLEPKEIKQAENLLEAARSVRIQDIKEFTYEPPKSDDIYSVFEEMAMMGGGGDDSSEREIEPCVTCSPASSLASKIYSTMSPRGEKVMMMARRGDRMYRLSNGDYVDDDGDSRSGWETVSQADDQGSSYSLEGSISNKKMVLQRRCSNVSGGSGTTEWEENGGDETPMTEISEVCSVRSKHHHQSKKVTSISRLWRSSYLNNSSNGGDNNYKIDGGRISCNGRRLSSNGGGIVMSPDWPIGNSSPDTTGHNNHNPHVGKGIKGCIEWPIGQKHSLKSKLLEARMESQKIQLRQVLKQKF